MQPLHLRRQLQQSAAASVFLVFDEERDGLVDARDLGFNEGRPQMELWQPGSSSREEILKAAAQECLKTGETVKLDSYEEVSELRPGY